MGRFMSDSWKCNDVAVAVADVLTFARNVMGDGKSRSPSPNHFMSDLQISLDGKFGNAIGISGCGTISSVIR